MISENSPSMGADDHVHMGHDNEELSVDERHGENADIMIDHQAGYASQLTMEQLQILSQFQVILL
jgi:hypothetical protein